MSPTTSPLRVADAPQPWPLHDVRATREIERAALSQLPPHALMARAGLACARLSLALAPHAREIAVLVGPGNNGGDGLHAALHLRQLGRRVRIWTGPLPDPVPGDAADAWRRARAAGLEWTGDPAQLAGAELLIDALLGIGASRPLDATMSAVALAANAGPAPVLSVDLPSGLHANSGRTTGPAAIRARWTMSLLTLKPGLFTAEGRDHAGDVWLEALGVQHAVAATALLGCRRHPPAQSFRPRHHAHHKGSFGDVVVVGGAPGMQGAATLAARAALAAGAGRVYLSPLQADPVVAVPPELMSRAAAWSEGPDRLHVTTVVCGCGAGPDVADVMLPLLAHAGRLVLDADALNAVARDGHLAQALQARAAAGRPTVLTPHPLEAARLLGSSTAEVQADRLRAAATLAQRLGATVVLKGSGTVVCATEGMPWINGSGNARLAAPGSGDVLAGWIGGLWAQGTVGDSVVAARAAVWLHGHAADQAGGSPHAALQAGTLIDHMVAALPA